MEWYLKCLKQYADFKGRARRKEYWMFFLFNFLFSVIFAVLDGILQTKGILEGLYSLAVLIPGLAVTVRRLHDIGKSGWMILIVLIPIVGMIWLLVLTVTDSALGENEYGPNPKQVAL